MKKKRVREKKRLREIRGHFHSHSISFVGHCAHGHYKTELILMRLFS